MPRFQCWPDGIQKNGSEQMIDARIGTAILLAAVCSVSSASAAGLVSDPSATCRGLAGPAADAVHVDSAQMQPASSLAVAERAPTPSARIAPANPAFCKV